MKYFSKIIITTLIALPVVLLVWLVVMSLSLNFIEAAYEEVQVGMTESQVDQAIGLFQQEEVTLQEIEPAWQPRRPEDKITRCGLGPFYFYVLYGGGVVDGTIPAYE